MCGINGIFAYHYAASAPSQKELLATRDHMADRGPDGVNEWWSPDRRMAFGHRRLAIQDLSDRASQPMVSKDGRYALVFNGEIYNTPELRAHLEGRGINVVSHGDTEVVLRLYALYGRDMLQRLRGMYAFAIWDDMERTLFLARDPYGIKPLYLSDDGWTLRFASSVKALIAGGQVSTDPEPAGHVGFHIFGSVPDPFTLYRDVRSLPAGHCQLITSRGPEAPRPFASIATSLSQTSTPVLDSDGVREALRESVRCHLLSDVPVGHFLSAGIDSGALLGLARDAGQEDVQAITLSFEEFENTPEDEAPLAAEVAKQYGAKHHIYRVSRAEYEADLPHILEKMDQPTIDGINVWFVAKAAKAFGLKVAFSGLGGDELLGGYSSFRDIPLAVRLAALPSRIPGAATVADAALGMLAPHSPKARGLIRYGGTWDGAYLLRRAVNLPEALSAVMDAGLVKEGLRRLDLKRRLREALTPTPQSAFRKVCALESSWYMRHQLLRDADWAGMAHSVEIRTPLVDYTLLNQLAPSLDVLSGMGKQVLARAPRVPLPDAVINRAKTGFGIPSGHWQRKADRAAVTNKGLASRTWAREVAQAFSTRTLSHGPTT